MSLVRPSPFFIEPISGWDLSTAAYDNSFFNVGPQGTTPQEVTFKPDGTKMYLGGNQAPDSVYQYTLSTPWVVSSASYDNVFLDVSGKVSAASGVEFSADGTTMIVLGGPQRSVYQYTLSTPWDIGTGSYASKFKSIATQLGSPNCIFFKPDGLIMYSVGNTNNTVYQYTLSAPWDVSTLVYSNIFKSVVAEDSVQRDVAFRPDGTRMFLAGDSNNTLFQYTLSTPWDVSTASYENISFSIASQAFDVSGMAFKADGSGFFILDSQDKRVYQYSL